MKSPKRHTISLVGSVIAAVFLAVGSVIIPAQVIPLACEAGSCPDHPGDSCAIGTQGNNVNCYCYDGTAIDGKCMISQ